MRLLIFQLVLAAYMGGVIWFVQIVQYPIFADVGSEAFEGYHEIYRRRVTWVVMPAMVVELLLAGASAVLFRGTKWVLWSMAGLVMVGGVWGTTFYLQVPLHAILSEGFSETTIDDLVSSNGWRTSIWSFRIALLAVWVMRFAKENPGGAPDG